MLRHHEPETPPTAVTDPIGERLLRARTIIISGEITQKLASTVSGQLLALAAESESDITIFINSQGGHVEAGDTIHDLIRFIRPRVRMIGTGWVASAGALIYVAAPREQRFCLPNTRFLLHQPAGAHQLDSVPQQLAQPAVGAHGGVGVVVAQAHGAPAVPHRGLHAVQQVALAAQAFEALHLLIGALHVAKVGHEAAHPAGPRAHHRQPVRAGESGQVADVEQICDQQRVEFPLA